MANVLPICQKFPGLRKEKFKKGIFDEQQIRQLKKDPNFVKSME